MERGYGNAISVYSPFEVNTISPTEYSYLEFSSLCRNNRCAGTGASGVGGALGNQKDRRCQANLSQDRHGLSHDPRQPRRIKLMAIAASRSAMIFEMPRKPCLPIHPVKRSPFQKPRPTSARFPNTDTSLTPSPT